MRSPLLTFNFRAALAATAVGLMVFAAPSTAATLSDIGALSPVGIVGWKANFAFVPWTVDSSSSGNAVALWQAKDASQNLSLQVSYFDSSTGSWSGAETIDSNLTPIGAFDDLRDNAASVVSNGGSAAVIWTNQGALKAAYRDATTGQWKGEQITSATISTLKLVARPDDSFTAAWVENAKSDFSFKTADRVGGASGGWSEPKRLTEEKELVLGDNPILTTNASGDQAILWQRDNPKGNYDEDLVIRATFRASGQSDWQKPQSVTKASEKVDRLETDFDLAVGPKGDSVIWWTTPGLSKQSLTASYRPAGVSGSWGSRQRVRGSRGGFVQGKDTFFNAAGSAMIFWTQSRGGGMTLRYTKLIGSKWAQARSVAPKSESVERFGWYIGTDSKNSLTAIWQRHRTVAAKTKNSLRSSSLGSGAGSWAEPATVAGSISNPRLAITGDKPIAVWETRKIGSKTVNLSYATAPSLTGAWSAAQSLGVTGKRPQVVARADGSALVVWEGRSAGKKLLQFRALSGL